MKIYKYRVSLGSGIRKIPSIPRVKEVLHLGVQDGHYAVWTLVDENVTEDFTYEVVHTGDAPTLPNAKHVGTAVLDSIGRVYHVFVQSTDGGVQEATPVSNNTTAPKLIVDETEYPENAVVFEYRKKDGTSRVMAMTHIEFGRNSDGEQYMSGYDYEAEGDSKFRTVYLSQVVSWAKFY